MYTTETSSEFIKVSKTNPCPLCDKPDWCKTSPDNTVVICPRTDTAPTGWKRIKDTVDGHGIYKLETGESFQKQVSGRRPTKRISKPKPAPIPAGSKLLRLPAPQRGPEPQKPQYIPEGVPASAVLITYSYSDTQQVYRFEWPDPNSPKGRDKTYRQTHIDINGKRVWKKGDKPWPAYRTDEVVKTLKGVPDDEPVVVLMLEGEPNVELARLHAIAALTLQGCKWNDAEITRAVEALRATGKNIVLAKLRDNDSTGVKKGSQIQSVCDRLQFPCIVIDPVAIYPDIPDKGDIKEILDNMDADEFIRRLEEEIHRQAADSARAIELDDEFDKIHEENLKCGDEPQTSTNLSMLEAAANEAREILRSELDELTTNIKLEELRQAAGVSADVWEHKIIKPLKRGMNGERFKLELLALMQMDDPVERLRQIALLAPKYSMGAGAIKEAMSAMRQRTQAPEVKILTLEELYDSESEAIEWLVPGLLPVGETVLLCALPKVGKSKAAVDLAFCVATGESRFLGQRTKQGRVLLITPDASPQSLKQELKKRGFRKQDTANLHVIPRWSIDQMAVLEAELENFRPDLVVIDSLKKITAGKEISENSAEFADNIIALNDMLTRYRAAGILVHHANKGNDAIGVERARGSTAIVGACWGTWMLDRIPKPDPNNPKKLIHDPKCPKRIFTATNRDSEGTTLNIEFNAENNSWDFISEVGVDEEEAAQQQTHRERILNILQTNSHRPLSGPDIMESLGVTREQRGPIYSELGRMENKRLISSKPASDKRCNLYFLPNFEAIDIKAVEVSETVPVVQKISQPPPPPIPTVSIADYSSEIHTVHGLENSQQNSQQIVSSNPDCDSYKIAETPTNTDTNPIVSSLPLSQGREGVKYTSATEIVTEVNVKLSQPTAPKSNAAELVNQIVATLQKAIAENDAGAIKKEIAKTKKRDSKGQLLLAVKTCLSDTEKEACKAAVNCSKQSQPPDSDELAAKLRHSSAAEPEAEPETAEPAPIALPDNSQPPEPAEPAPTPTPADAPPEPETAQTAQPTDTSSQPELEAEPTGLEVVEDVE